MAGVPPTKDAPKPYRPDLERVRLFAEYQDLPFALMIACWNAEKGLPGIEWGQLRVSWEVPVLFPGEVQLAQAARTIRNARRHFIKALL